MGRRIVLCLVVILGLALVGCNFGFLDDLEDKKTRDDYPTTVFYGTNGFLYRMNTDGSNSKILISSLDHPPAGLAINRKAGILYWADQTSPYKVYQATTAGTNLTEVLSTNLSTVTGIDVDESTGYIYMAEYGAHRILKVPPGTTNGNANSYVLSITGGVTAPRDVSVDRERGILFVSEGGIIVRVSLTGGAKTPSVYNNTDIPFSLELDLANNNLYWSDIGTGAGSGNGDSMFRTSRTSPDNNATNSDLGISSLEDPRSLALYPDAGILYWVSGNFFTGGTLCRGDTDKLSGNVSGFEFATITGVSTVVVDYYIGN